MDPLVVHRHSDSSCSSSVDAIEMVPIVDSVDPTPGSDWSVPTCLTGKIVGDRHFTAEDMGHVKEVS